MIRKLWSDWGDEVVRTTRKEQFWRKIDTIALIVLAMYIVATTYFTMLYFKTRSTELLRIVTPDRSTYVISPIVVSAESEQK